MTASDTPNSAAEQKRAERLDVARTVYHALAAQDADRVMNLCDIRGRLIARHDLRPEQGDEHARSASSAIFAFNAASIFRLVLRVILRSVRCGELV
jgi:hypothetical protein